MSDLVNKEYLSKQFSGYSTVVKKQLDKKIDVQQNVADANKILGIGEDGVVTPIEAPISVKVSAKSDNQIEEKQDGLYVKDMSAKISAEQDNALIEKQDGLYVPTVAEAKVSQEQNNIISSKADGLFAEDAIVEIKVDGTAAPITDKTVDIALKSVTDLENYYDKEKVDDLLEAITTLNISVVDILPTADISTTTIYLVAKTGTEEQNIYSEYICLDATVPTWECIGDTKVDLAEYAKTDDVNTALELKADKTELDVYVTDTDLTNKCYATETWVNEQGFLTQHQDLSNYATKDEIPTTLPANGGNSDTVNNHTVKSDVPENAVFTDTVYDDSALKTELTTAIATAKSEAIKTILGEAVSEDFDTLQEVADWIQADTTGSAELIIRVTNAESDIDTLEETISNKVDKVDGKGLSTNDFTDTYQSDVDGNTIARHTHSNTTVLDNTTASFTIEEKEKLSSIKDGAESSVSTVTGVNPTVTNSTKAPLIYLKEDGYTEQTTLSGNNLFSINITNFTLIDNSIKNINQSGNMGQATLKAGKTYSLSLILISKPENDTSMVSNINDVADSGGISFIGIHNFNLNEKYTRTYVPTEDCTLSIIMHGNSGGNTFSFQLWIEEGTSTNYEPYCGGMASPNPDYPQEIKSLGDNGTIEVKTVGKNLFRNTLTTHTYNGLTFTVNDDKSVTVNGTATIDTWMNVGYANVDNSKKYSLSGCPTGGNWGKYGFIIDSNGVARDYGNGAILVPSVTGKANFILAVWGGVTVSNLKFYPQLELGEISTPYEPYTETTALIPIDAPFYDGDYIEVYADGSGKIVRNSYAYSVNGDNVYFHDEWGNSSDNSVNFTLTKAPYKPKSDGKQYANWLQHCTSDNAMWNDQTYTGFFVQSKNDVRVRISGYGNDKTTITEMFNTNPLFIVYEMDESIIEPLTAEQVAEFKKLRTFNEVTHINADGTTTVRYYVNTDSGNTVGMLHEQITSVESYIKTLEERLTALEDA